MTSENADLVKLTYVEGPKHLHVSRKDVVFWVDGVERTFKSTLHGELLSVLVRSHPSTVTAEDIFEHFRQVSPVGSRISLEQTIHKFVHGTRQDLMSSGLKMDVIKNVRGRGYRLAEGWKIDGAQDPFALVETELRQLRNLARRCIDYVESRPVIENKAGLLYVDTESHVAQENFLILDRIGWQLLHNISNPELVPDILDIKRDLSNLMSYVVFWRVGHRMDEKAWKSDYKQEVRKIFTDIEMRVRKIRNAANPSLF